MAARKNPLPATVLPFDVRAFLVSAGLSHRFVRFARGAVVFAQGAQANSVFYVQDGSVKLSVLSPGGKEAIVAMLGSGDFFGEGCLAGQTLRMGTATAIVPTTVLRIPKREMPKLSQETLALMVGTTRSRVNFFMNKFRKLGFIRYHGGLAINGSLLSVVLQN